MEFDRKHKSIVNIGEVDVESKNEQKCTNLIQWTNSYVEMHLQL